MIRLLRQAVILYPRGALLEALPTHAAGIVGIVVADLIVVLPCAGCRTGRGGRPFDFWFACGLGGDSAKPVNRGLAVVTASLQAGSTTYLIALGKDCWSIQWTNLIMHCYIADPVPIVTWATRFHGALSKPCLLATSARLQHRSPLGSLRHSRLFGSINSLT